MSEHAVTVPMPGTRCGPCDDACSHDDCVKLRAMAAAKCTLCGCAIGFDSRFWVDREGDERTYTHASCSEDEACR